MAAIPQGAFAARKVRQNLERGNFLISKMEGKGGGKNESKGGTYNSKPPQTGRELTPLKYNSKLMNSIWGLYNRYSVHNFKKNTDAGDGVFSAAWELIFRDVSPALSSASVVATAAANPLRSKNNM